MVDSNSTTDGGLPILEMPDFAMEDPQDGSSPSWLPHLQEHGVVVVKNVMDSEQVQRAVDLYWEFLDKNFQFMKRRNPKMWSEDGKQDLVVKDASTLQNKNWPVTIHGFSAQNYCNHSEAAWYMRTLPNVKKCFAQIYETDDLITSFDTIICWRQWWLGPEDDYTGTAKWLPRTEGLHVDQNPISKKGFHCIQGMLLLQDIDERIGGFEVIQDTANDAA